MNIVVLGNRRAGKTSILKKVFHKISLHETQFLEPTTKIQEYPVNNNIYTKCTFFDFPGNFEISQMNSTEHKHLESANILIYVLDAQDEPYHRKIEKFLTLQSEVYEINPYCLFEFLVHKTDGEMFRDDESKNLVFNEISELIKLNSQERSLPPAEIFLTSIMDNSICLCLSKVLQKSNPVLLNFSAALDLFISLSMIEKVYVVDVVSKLFIATDSRPIDFVSYEWCCEAIDVSIELSMIYGYLVFRVSGEGFEEAFDCNTSAVIGCDNGYNIYLAYFDHLLAIVCILKDTSFLKKEIVKVNIQSLRKTFEKILKSCDRLVGLGEEKKKT